MSREARERCERRDEVKRLLTEWAVLDRLYRTTEDGEVLDAIEARREILRTQIDALASAREAA